MPSPTSRRASPTRSPRAGSTDPAPLALRLVVPEARERLGRPAPVDLLVELRELAADGDAPIPELDEHVAQERGQTQRGLEQHDGSRIAGERPQTLAPP